MSGVQVLLGYIISHEIFNVALLVACNLLLNDVAVMILVLPRIFLPARYRISQCEAYPLGQSNRLRCLDFNHDIQGSRIC